MDKLIYLSRHLSNEPAVWFRLPDFVRIDQTIDGGAPINGEFVGHDKKVDAALFNVDGEHFLYVNRRIHVLSSPYVECCYFTFAGIEIFVLWSENHLRAVRINVVRPRFIRVLLDPTYDDFNAIGEDFWYATYTRWRGRRMKGKPL